MTIFEGVIAGVVGSALYQLLIIYDYRASKKRWPWAGGDEGLTIPFFIFGFSLKLCIAGVVVFALINNNQINGILGAGLIGVSADEVLRSAARSGRKEALSA
jgi:O-antigen/teichoic acid export membrane protein